MRIELNDVSFSYPNGFLAVDNINLTINSGEKVAIVGQNGAGKSTTARMLNGLQRPSEGTIMIGDMNTKDYTTAQLSRMVGYVFQNPDDQIFHSKVIDEVQYGLKKMNLSEEEIERRVNYSLEITGMEEYAEENPYNLPLSLRKFVTIASIIAMDCPIMIFDEPTAGQDMSGNITLENIINELHSRKKTIIIITHDMEFVVKNFEKVIVMANKRVIKVDETREVFWDLPVLREANLHQPYISKLCHDLNIGGKILTIEEAINELYKSELEEG